MKISSVSAYYHKNSNESIWTEQAVIGKNENTDNIWHLFKETTRTLNLFSRS